MQVSYAFFAFNKREENGKMSDHFNSEDDEMETRDFEGVVYENPCGLTFLYDFTATRPWSDEKAKWDATITEVRQVNGEVVMPDFIVLRSFASVSMNPLLDLLTVHAKCWAEDHEGDEE